MEEVNTGESWNKKRIAISILILILMLVGGYYFKTHILGESSVQIKKNVKGVSISASLTPEAKIDIQQTVKDKLDSLKQEVSNLNIMEIATSSSQVQKILNDIKSLEQYPTNQIKEVCKKTK